MEQKGKGEYTGRIYACGKSLYKDFRPPSAEGETGPYYTQMIAEYREAIGDIDARFPTLKGHQPELRGFVWFQGWNDMCDAQGREEYAKNLELLIRDVRNDLQAPALPVVSTTLPVITAGGLKLPSIG